MASIHKRGKDTWEVRISYTDKNKERRYFSKSGFKTKSEARVFATKMENEIYQNINFEDVKTLFPLYFKKWYEIYKEKEISKSTQHKYENTQRIVNNYFRNIPIGKITRTTYKEFIDDFAKDHAKSTVEVVHTHIKACAQLAFHDRVLPTDFTFNVKYHGNEEHEREIKWLSSEQSKNLINYCLKNFNINNLSLYIIFIDVLTGLRFSEILALTYSDINYNFKTISVDKSWDSKFKQKFIAPKTKKSIRIVRAPQVVFTILKELQNYQESIQKENKDFNEHNLLFVKSDGELPSNTALNKELKLIQSKIGVPKDKQVSFHGLRHTYASYLLYKGVSVYQISKYLGHSSYEITLKVYTHIIDELEARESEKISNALNELSTSPINFDESNINFNNR